MSKVHICFACFIFLFAWKGFAQEAHTFREDTISINTAQGRVYASLIVPGNKTDILPVALIIAGSGPTDRNGNNPYMTNNSLKMLAESLAKSGIASLRYDKRGVGASIIAGIQEIDLRFEDYVEDASNCINFLKKDTRFDCISVIGHSEGSLIGMMAAARTGVDAFISMAGPGEPADLILKRQLKSQPESVQQELFPMIDSLKEGYTVQKVNPAYLALFRPTVQPYLISWFKYDPAAEIRNLNIPVLIIQGTTDLQVRIEDAELLKEAAPDAIIEMIDGMNHILKTSSADRQENIATYSNPDLSIREDLMDILINFIDDNCE